MTTDEVARAVRGHLGLGRLVALGGPQDAAWIAERAAVRVLRQAERAVPGTRLAGTRISLAEPAAHDWAVPAGNPAAPPSALPAGPLRITADVLAPADRPLPRTADDLRTAVLDAAESRLGLTVALVDLRVVGLLDPDTPEPEHEPEPRAPSAADWPGPAADGADRARDTALTVPGVRTALVRPGPDHTLRAHLTLDAGHRALDVARAVRTATGVAAVVVTDTG